MDRCRVISRSFSAIYSDGVLGSLSHTDNMPINTGCVKDNWDLSVDRSVAIVRALQQDHGVDPTRLTASGRSEYIPKADNSSVDGRSTNRRTEIIITPRLDQFLELHQIEEEGE